MKEIAKCVFLTVIVYSGIYLMQELAVTLTSVVLRDMLLCFFRRTAELVQTG